MTEFEELLTVACGSTDPLDLILHGGGVQRFHSEGRHFHQDVAQHTWRVMVILLHLWPETPPQALLAVLYHDVSEALTGDIPAPVKRNPAVREAVELLDAAFMARLDLPQDLTYREYNRMKCADYIEMCFTCLDTPGKEAKRVYDNGVRFIREAAARLGGEDEKKVANFMSERFPL
jgi:5'-deoxynucleotidase YfbR-like HD superfamily hydrolase